MYIPMKVEICFSAGAVFIRFYKWERLGDFVLCKSLKCGTSTRSSAIVDAILEASTGGYEEGGRIFLTFGRAL
jgi:hypothetical protein